MVELGLLGDQEGDEEPALRCRAAPEGREEPGGTPVGVGGPGEPREDPPDSDSGGVARQGADVASIPGGGGGAPHHGCGCKQLASPGLAQRAHPLALPRAEPATAAAPARAQPTTAVTAAPLRPRRRAQGGGLGIVARDAPPGRAGPPDPHPPPTVQCSGGTRATSSAREDGGTERERTPTAPRPDNRGPLTRATAPSAHRPSPPPPPPRRPAGTARRQRGEQETRARACARARHPRAEGRRGKGTPPPVSGWPPGPEATRPPPRGRRGAAPGGRGGTGGEPPHHSPPPSSPPPPSPWAAGGRPERQRPRIPPGGAAAPRGETPQQRRTQPRVKRPRSAARTLPHDPLPAGGSAPAP